MSAAPAPLARAADRVLAALTDPRYAHTSHLHVRVGGRVVVDEHLTGPLAGDVFSVTKSILATAVGVVAQQGRLPGLDMPVAGVLPELRGTAAEAHTCGTCTGDPQFRLGTPPSDALPDDWRPALDLVRQHLVPALR